MRGARPRQIREIVIARSMDGPNDQAQRLVAESEVDDTRARLMISETARGGPGALQRGSNEKARLRPARRTDRGLPWIHCRFRESNGNWGYHSLAFNHDGWVRVRKR